MHLHQIISGFCFDHTYLQSKMSYNRIESGLIITNPETSISVKIIASLILCLVKKMCIRAFWQTNIANITIDIRAHL